jgi:hypothetical protein
MGGNVKITRMERRCQRLSLTIGVDFGWLTSGSDKKFQKVKNTE